MRSISPHVERQVFPGGCFFAAAAAEVGTDLARCAMRSLRSNPTGSSCWSDLAARRSSSTNSSPTPIRLSSLSSSTPCWSPPTHPSFFTETRPLLNVPGRLFASGCRACPASPSAGRGEATAAARHAAARPPPSIAARVEVRPPLANQAVLQNDSVDNRPLKRPAAQVAGQGELNEHSVGCLSPTLQFAVEVRHGLEQGPRSSRSAESAGPRVLPPFAYRRYVSYILAVCMSTVSARSEPAPCASHASASGSPPTTGRRVRRPRSGRTLDGGNDLGT